MMHSIMKITSVYYFTFSIVVYIAIYLANSIAEVSYEREGCLTVVLKKLEEAEKS